MSWITKKSVREEASALIRQGRYIEIFVPDTDTFEELVEKAEKVEEWTKRVKELENASII